MSPDSLPTWLTVPLVILASGSALYLHWIKPGFEKDRSEHSEQLCGP